MKNVKAMKRLGLLLLLVCALALSGCYANTPTIEGTTGDLYPEYPTQNVNPNTPAPSAEATQGSNVVVTLPSSQPNATVNVINQQTPIILNNTTAAPVIGGATLPPLTIQTDEPTATPSNILKLGATGAAVKDLQQKLKALGYLKGSADGDFGEMTETAVKQFQQQMGLEVDGIAGIETLRKLASTSVTAKPQKTATPKPTATAKPQYSEDTYLQVGSTGSLVTKMQDRLIQLGYLDGEATGRFDASTEAAVIAFQKRNCSYWDGIAGKVTLDALFSSSAKGTSTSAGVVGTSLKVGSTGSAVSTLQSRLKKLGYYSGSVDGDFGTSTEEAVKAFQKKNGLTADGKAGSETLAKLNSSSAVAAGSDVLEMGSRGDEVVTLQNRLKKLGYYSGNVDGDFGESTANAVRAFQRRNGLTVDGRVGDATAAQLFSSSAKAAATATPKPTSTPKPTATPSSLQMGSSGEKVVRIQSRLKTLGFYSGNVDGDFGAATRDAVRAFQRANGLTVDGKVGDATWNKLNGSSATPKPSTNATAVPDNVYVLVTPAPDGSYVTLERGHYGSLVRELQQELKNQGYYNGTADGYFGETTEAAVKKLQAAKGLKQDGKAGHATQRVLFEGDFPFGS